MYRITTLYTLCLYKAICQLYLNKAGGGGTRAHSPCQTLSCMEEGLSLLRWELVTQPSALQTGGGHRRLIWGLDTPHLGTGYRPWGPTWTPGAEGYLFSIQCQPHSPAPTLGAGVGWKKEKKLKIREDRKGIVGEKERMKEIQKEKYSPKKKKKPTNPTFLALRALRPE